MVGTARKSLAGAAAAAAKRAIGRRGALKDNATPATPPAKKAAAKKATPVKKATAKKVVPVKKAVPAKKVAPAKKAAVKKASVKKAAPTKEAAPKTPEKAAAPAKKSVPSTSAPAKKANPVTKAAPAKKSAPRKATPARLVVLEGEDPWTRAELNEVVKELGEHRERLAVSVAEAEAELAGLMRDAGDGAGQDQADVGATSFERDHELTVLAKERDAIEQIDRALGHIDDGSYGVCESCGNPIGKNRLMAVPHATLCLSCKQREERR